MKSTRFLDSRNVAEDTFSDASKLEKVLNDNAKQGWKVRAVATLHNYTIILRGRLLPAKRPAPTRGATTGKFSFRGEVECPHLPTCLDSATQVKIKRRDTMMG